MKLEVDLEKDGQTQRIRISPMAWIGWEEYSGRKMSDMAQGGLGMGELCQLTMEQLRLQGEDLKLTDWKTWAADVVDLSPVGDEPTADPPTGSGGASDGP